MGFASTAQSSLNSNRKIRSSEKRVFRPTHEKFAVKASPKIELAEESKRRAEENKDSKAKIMLATILISSILLGITLYLYIT